MTTAFGGRIEGVARISSKTSRDRDAPAEQVARAGAGRALAGPPSSAPLTRGARDQAAPPSEFGPHSPIPSPARERLESGFGQQLDFVRIHSGPTASMVARSVSARALSLGTSVAFGPGQFDPSSESGLRLLAHEVSHVLSPSPADGVGRREVMAYPDITGDTNPPGNDLYATVKPAIASVGSAPDDAAWKATVNSAVNAWIDSWHSDPSAAGAQDARAALALLLPSLNDYSNLKALAAVQTQLGPDGLGPPEGLAAAAVHRQLAEGMAGYIYMKAEGLPDAYEKAVYYFRGLHRAADAVRTAEGRYQLELEGALTALVDSRAEFNTAGADRRALGARIGILARRALLLAATIEDLRKEQGRPPANAVADPLARANGRIRAIRGEAATESKTRAALDERNGLGAGAAQLAVMPLPQQPRTIQTAHILGIAPELALPETTDQGVKAMLFQAEGQLSEQEKLTKDLHDSVVPPKSERRYTLPEFAQVYRRWSGFHSPEQERQDPMFRMWASFFDRRAMLDATGGMSKDPEERQKQLEKVRTPYELTGIPSGISSISGAGARAFMMWIFVDRLAEAMGDATTEFTGSLPPARVDPIKVTGSATSPSARRTTGFEISTPAGAKIASPPTTARHGSETSSGRFTDVAKNPTQGPGANQKDLVRLIGPEAGKLKNPDAALVGIRAVTADEGWTYLVDVWEDESTARAHGRSEPEIVAREQRTISPEVARYLLAQRQLNALQGASTVPRLPTGSGAQSGAAVGEAAVRTQGLVAATAVNAATAKGEPAVVSPEVKKAADHLATAKRAAQPQPGDLVRELTDYLDEFLRAKSDTAFRVAAVLVIAQAEHGIKRTLDEGTSAGHFFEVSAYATGITFGTAILDNLGPLGKVVNAGISGYLQSNNCSPLAAVVGLAMWMHQVAKVTDFRHARAYAFASQAAVADLLSLMDEVVSRAATKTAHAAITRITQGPAASPRSLVAAMGEVARTKGAKEPMLAEINAQLTELGRAGKHNTPEYRLLEAMQVEVTQTTSPRAEIETARDSVIQPSKAVDLTTGPLASFRLRTDAEIAPLRDAVPADLRARVRVVQDPLLSGNTVHSVPLANEVQIRVGPDATRAEVEQHLGTARDQARFTGTLGKVRATLEGYTDLLAGRRARGTRGREAEQEIAKLALIAEDLKARRDWIEGRASQVDRPLSAAERAEADAQLRSIESQIELHSRDLGSLQAGRGFVAAVDSRATVRDALLRRGADPAEARDFVRDLDKLGQLDSFAQLVSVGTYQRLRNGGVTDDAIVATLQKPHGYRDLVRADLSPEAAGSRVTLGAAAARALADERSGRARMMAAQTPVDRHRAEWGITNADEFSGAELKAQTGLSVGEVMKLSRTAEPTSEPRILWRWKRYVDRMGPRTSDQFAKWAEAGFRANVNRDASSPFERTAIEQTGGFLNNEALGVGGQKSYTYGEWVDKQGKVIRTGITGGRRPSNAADFTEITTRPDGVRPRPDGGFDVIEHKHMTSPEGDVLHDSLQLRAQREMVQREGKGRHELILSSDRPLGADGLPQVRPSKTVGQAPGCVVYYLHDGAITHTYNPTTDTWQAGHKAQP